jgi:sRNA-binding regulator protein Hfq
MEKSSIKLIDEFSMHKDRNIHPIITFYLKNGEFIKGSIASIKNKIIIVQEFKKEYCVFVEPEIIEYFTIQNDDIINCL